MKVKELIKNLMDYDMDLNVVIKLDGKETIKNMSGILHITENRMYSVVLIEPVDYLADRDKQTELKG
jgi:hypothetical protein